MFLELSIKVDHQGRLVFYEPLSSKILNTVIIVLLLCAVWYFWLDLPENQKYESWQFQAAASSGLIFLLLIWPNGYIRFDEMMKVVVFKRWLRKLIGAKKIYYPDVSELVLKHHISTHEDGSTTHEGFFHLRLKNNKNYLLFSFTGSKKIHQAKKLLNDHTDLTVTVY